MMHRHKLQFGFSLLELLVTMALLLIISAAVFGLLNVAQSRYRNEEQFLNSFQNARVGVEQLTREIHNAGFPGVNTYTLAATPAYKFALPFRGYTGTYPTLGTYAYTQACTVPANCLVPGSYDISMEMDLDPYNPNCPNQVEIVEYSLQPDGNGTTSTLMRSVTSKPGNGAFPGGPPGGPCQPLWTSWAGNTWVPFIENVVNFYGVVNGTPSVPAASPIFTFQCDSAPCNPQNVNNVLISLWVRQQGVDLNPNIVRTVNLQAMAQRLNPNQ
jgi:prepilin-type N-terminal cleavage/methylation domain-containing protein